MAVHTFANPWTCEIFGNNRVGESDRWTGRRLKVLPYQLRLGFSCVLPFRGDGLSWKHMCSGRLQLRHKRKSDSGFVLRKADDLFKCLGDGLSRKKASYGCYHRFDL